MYFLYIERVRVDLGNDLFVDAPEARFSYLVESKSIENLAQKLHEFVEKRHGQIIEIADGRVTLDTSDLTITCCLGSADDESREPLDVTLEEEEALYDALMMSKTEREFDID